jgi:hypothetical protein
VIFTNPVARLHIGNFERRTIAVAGDLRRICDLFGVTIAIAQHYTGVLSHPALDGPHSDLIASARPASGQKNKATYRT